MSARDSGGAAQALAADFGTEPGDPGPQPRESGRGPRQRRGTKTPPMPTEPLFRPWEVIDPAAVPPRDFIYGRHYIRGFASVSLAPGGGNKTALIIAESVAIATGRPLLGIQPKRRERVVYFNAEDPRDEVNRRVLAICQHFAVPQEELVDWLFTESGRDQDITLAYGVDGEIHEPAFAMMERFAKTYGPGVMNFDPLQAMTTSPETNDVFRVLGRRLSALASTANCAVGLAHHLRKLGGREAEIEDSRGGVALIGTVRSARVTNPMTREEAPKAGLHTHIHHFRVDGAGIGKNNLTPPSDHADWYRRVSVALPNGDNVAVVEAWKWPDPFEGVNTADALRVQRAIAACPEPPNENAQATAWAGYVVAETLGLETKTKGQRARISSMIKAWLEQDVLRVERIKDTRHTRETPVIVAGGNRLDEAED